MKAKDGSAGLRIPAHRPFGCLMGSSTEVRLGRDTKVAEEGVRLPSMEMRSERRLRDGEQDGIAMTGTVEGEDVATCFSPPTIP